MRGGFKPRLKFPIIIIENNGSASCARDEKTTFVKWTKSTAKNEEYYKKVRILDSLGRFFKITKVDILGYSNIFWGLDVFLNQTVIADVYVEEIDTPDLPIIKKLLENAVRTDQHYYESGDIDWRKLIKDIQAAPNLSVLMELLEEANGNSNDEKAG